MLYLFYPAFIAWTSDQQTRFQNGDVDDDDDEEEETIDNGN